MSEFGRDSILLLKYNCNECRTEFYTPVIRTLDGYTSKIYCPICLGEVSYEETLRAYHEPYRSMLER